MFLPLLHIKKPYTFCTIQKSETIFKSVPSSTPLLSSNAIPNTGIYENQLLRSQEQNWEPRPNGAQRFLQRLGSVTIVNRRELWPYKAEDANQSFMAG